MNWALSLDQLLTRNVTGHWNHHTSLVLGSVQPYSIIKLHILSLYIYSHPHSYSQRPTLNLDLEYLGFSLTLENKIISTSIPAIVSYSHAGAINRTLSSLGQGLPHPARPPVRTWNPVSEPQLRVVTAGRLYNGGGLLISLGLPTTPTPGLSVAGLAQMMGYIPHYSVLLPTHHSSQNLSSAIAYQLDSCLKWLPCTWWGSSAPPPLPTTHTHTCLVYLTTPLR